MGSSWWEKPYGINGVINIIDDCNVCGGNNASMDECGVCDGNGSTCSSVELSFSVASNGSVDILYNASDDISGSQFDISGMNITIVTDSSNDLDGFELLKAFGMPFVLNN